MLIRNDERDRLRQTNRSLVQELVKFNLLDPPRPSQSGKPPEALDQLQAAKLAAHVCEVAGFFYRRLAAGQRVYFVTVVNPAWFTSRGNLSPDVLLKVREWTARRARRLAPHGRYAVLGVVDLSFNTDSYDKEVGVWVPHVHLLVWVKAPATYKVDKLLSAAFRTPADRARVATPTQVRELPAHGDIERVNGYNSRRLSLAPLGQRTSYLDERNRRNTRDRPLKQKQRRELLAALMDFPPRRRVVISGFEWRGDRIKRRAQNPTIQRSIRYQPGVFE